jgi:hypothetical protein
MNWISLPTEPVAGQRQAFLPRRPESWPLARWPLTLDSEIRGGEASAATFWLQARTCISVACCLAGVPWFLPRSRIMAPSISNGRHRQAQRLKRRLNLSCRRGEPSRILEARDMGAPSRPMQEAFAGVSTCWSSDSAADACPRRVSRAASCRRPD